jgi:serine protease Do
MKNEAEFPEIFPAMRSQTRFLAAFFASVFAASVASAAEEISPVEMARKLNTAFVEVADRVSASVVVIRVAHRPDAVHVNAEDNPFFEFLPKEFREQMREEMEKQRRRDRSGGRRDPVFDGQGSGIVMREDGYILTNRHVVDGAEKIKVRFRDGREFDAELRGADKKSDLAVVRINTKGLPALKFADSSRTRVGEFAIAIGAPFELDYSVTFGHVSAVGRSRIIPDPSLDQDFIQTDANINPGNSGGPLVNISGDVIGINTLIRGLRTGIGFAIPANLARDIGERLISDGKYVRSWLGVAIQSLSESPELRASAKGVTDGVVIKEINPGGPAADSELKPLDIVTAVDGKAVTTSQALRNEIRSKKVGQPVSLDVNRNGKAMKISVKPGAWPEAPEVAFRKPERLDELEDSDLGLTVRTLSKPVAEEFKVKLTEGVIVTAVEKDGIAEKKGIKRGDIIKEINQKPTANVKAFGDAVKAGDLKKGLIVSLVSKGAAKFEVLRDDE